jgi:dihydrofolate reductase
MRKLTGAVFQSLDGVMQAPGGPEEDPTNFEHGGWVAPFWDDSLNEPFVSLFAQPYELLLVRRTYEIFAAYWPHNGDQPIGEQFNATAKHVVTSRDEPLTWNNSHRLQGDPAEAIAALKQREGPDLLVQGSSQLYDALLPAGLLDRFVLLTYPVILGHGKRWTVDDPRAAQGWQLTQQAVSSTGVLFASYERAGEVKTGTFASKPPSEDEIALRQRMKEGRW